MQYHLYYVISLPKKPFIYIYMYTHIHTHFFMSSLNKHLLNVLYYLTGTLTDVEYISNSKYKNIKQGPVHMKFITYMCIYLYAN